MTDHPMEVRHIVQVAFLKSRNDEIHTVRDLDWSGLSTLLGRAQSGEKDGHAWMPVNIEKGPGSAGRVEAVNLLVLNVEAATKQDPETGGRTVIGPQPPGVPEMVSELALFGGTYLLHTTYSHLDPEILPFGVDHPRYRLVFALSRPLKPDEVRPLGHHVASVLGISDAVDSAALAPERLFYLPRTPECRRDAFEFHSAEGESLDVDALLNEARRAEKALETAARTRTVQRSGDVIRAFNASQEIGSILEAAGYVPRGCRWMHPESTTGTPEVRILPGSNPPCVFSSHGGDPLNDGHAHDGFDCNRILVHDGDMTVAVREAAKIVGLPLPSHENLSTPPPLHGEASADPDAEAEYPTPPPQPSEKMFYGLVGKVAHAGADGREVSPVAVALAFITWLSAQIGPDAFLPIGDVRHRILINGLHTGAPMMAAKSESTALVQRIDDTIRGGSCGESSPMLGPCHTGGLSTSEALALLVHDGYRAGKEDIPPIDDKRLWVCEPKFGGLLERMKRPGNALFEALCDLNDGGSIQPATKTSQLWSTSPHIAVHAIIIPAELRLKLDDNAIHNKLVKRFLIAWAERTSLVPLPAPTDTATVEALAKAVQEVLTFSLGSYPEKKYTRAMQVSPEAQEMYADAYPDLRARDPRGETVTTLLERRAPITLRLAALFALTDRTLTIRPEHLEAALAWAAYHRDSVRFVFSRDADRRQPARDLIGLREKVLAFLRDAGDWVGRAVIVRRAFNNHIKRDDLTPVLQALLADREIEQREESNSNNPGLKTLYRIPGAKPSDE